MAGLHFDNSPHKYEPAHMVDADSESPSSGSVRYKRHGAFSPSEWLLEMGTTIFSLLCLATIIGILCYIHDKPLSSWKGTISANTVIAILSSACTAAMMHGVSEFIGQMKWFQFKRGFQKLDNLEKFDEASRGPLGSFKLLFLNWNLATLGAWITILQLTFSPFTQQVVHLDERLVATPDNNATFGFAHSYDRGRSLANHLEGAFPQDPGMQGAIVQGLFNISSPDTFSCSGACRWTDRYVSLGFKSSCSNVTQATLRTAQCGKDSKNSVSNVCNMTTPGGLRVTTRHVNTDSTTTYWMNAIRISNRTFIPSNTPELARFALYRATADYNFNAQDVNVTECSLSLTTYEYTGAHANGSTFSFDKIREVDFGSQLRWGWGKAKAGDEMYMNESTAQQTPRLSIAWNDLAALGVFLESNTIVSEWVDGNTVNEHFGLSAALAGDVDVGKRFEKLALSMTSYLRSGPNKQLAQGEILRNEAFVEIRWLYLIGPIVIELAVLVFAAMTIFRNRRSANVPLWKSSALAVFACHYDAQDKRIKVQETDIKQIGKMAEHTSARLE